MKGTVSKVTRTQNIDGSFLYSARIHRTFPEPPDDIDLLDLPLWVYEDLRAAQAGKNPVTLTVDGAGNVTSVTVG